MTDAQKLLEDVWIELVEKTDRTLPPEYPDMALITKDELGSALRVAIEAAAKVAEQQRPMVDCQGIMRLGFLQGGMEIASAIRALLPPEETP
jgi:hypothetical protein